MAHHPQSKITGELRRWRRKASGIVGYVYDSDVYDDGDECFFLSSSGELKEYSTFYLYEMATQTYKLHKDEEMT
jgi:hypothetical protein